MSDQDYTRLKNEITCSLPSSEITRTNDVISDDFDEPSATSLFLVSGDVSDNKKSHGIRAENTFNFVKMENNCSTLLSQPLHSLSRNGENTAPNTTQNNASSCNYTHISSDYNVMKEELNDLRSNLTKFCADLLLNELKIELNYLVEKVKNDLDQSIRAKLNQLIYEQTILTAKLASIECKLLNNFNIVLDETSTFLHEENEEIENSEV